MSNYDSSTNSGIVPYRGLYTNSGIVPYRGLYTNSGIVPYRGLYTNSGIVPYRGLYTNSGIVPYRGLYTNSGGGGGVRFACQLDLRWGSFIHSSGKTTQIHVYKHTHTYSGTPLNRTPLGQIKVSRMVRCVLIQGLLRHLLFLLREPVLLKTSSFLLESLPFRAAVFPCSPPPSFPAFFFLLHNTIQVHIQHECWKNIRGTEGLNSSEREGLNSSGREGLNSSAREGLNCKESTYRYIG